MAVALPTMNEVPSAGGWAHLEEEDAETSLRVRLLRDTTRGSAAGYLPGLFQLRLRGNPQGGRFDPVRIHDLPARPYDSAPGDQRWRLRVGDVVLRLNDRRITSFRTLDAILEYIRKQRRALEVYISATRRGEEPVAISRRIRNAYLVHHVQGFLVQALASVYKRPAVTQEERRLAAAAGVSWSSKRSCLKLFALGEGGLKGGWYDTLDVRIRKLFSSQMVNTPRQDYLHGSGGGAASDSGGSRRRSVYPAGMTSPQQAMGGYEGHMYGSQGHTPQSRHQRPATGGGFAGLTGGGITGMLRQASGENPGMGLFGDAASNLGGLGGLGGLGSLGAVLRQEDAFWLELRSLKAGCRHESGLLPLGSSSTGAVDVREDVLMPVLPFGDQLQVTLYKGKQHLINAGSGGALAVGKKKEHELGTGTIAVSFEDMKEALPCDYPNVALIGPNGGEVVAYVHLKLTYRTHSDLGRDDAASTIQSHFRGLLLRKRELRRYEENQAKQKKQARSRRKERDKRLLKVTKWVQRRWRYNRPKQLQILRQLSAFVEHDKALLRKPLRICLQTIDGDVHTPWGGRLLLYGDLDAIDSLQLLFRPPTDVFYRSYATMRRAVQDTSAMGKAIPRWVSEHVPTLLDSSADALIQKQRRAVEAQREQRASRVEETSELSTVEASASPTGTTRTSSPSGYVDVPNSAYSALLMGEPLPLAKIMSVRVYDYSEMRLELTLARDWFPSASATACELVLQAHSSAAMLVWFELLKIGVRGKWKVEQTASPSGLHTVRPVPPPKPSKSSIVAEPLPSVASSPAAGLQRLEGPPAESQRESTRGAAASEKGRPLTKRTMSFLSRRRRWMAQRIARVSKGVSSGVSKLVRATKRQKEKDGTGQSTQAQGSSGNQSPTSPKSPLLQPAAAQLQQLQMVSAVGEDSVVTAAEDSVVSRA